MKTTKIPGIYQITSLRDSRFYIGSAVCLSGRKCIHFKKLREETHHNIYLQSLYNKYGKDNLQFKIITTIKDKHQLIELEQFYLDLLNPQLNICKIAGSTLGLKKSKEERLAMSLRRKGSKATNALETYQISLTGDILALYETTRSAMNSTGIWQGNISSVCRGEQHSTGGYIWCYKKNLDNEITTVEKLVQNYKGSLKFLSLKNKNSKHLLQHGN